MFEVQGDDWYISNISLRNAQDTSFSPDEFTIIQDIPRKTATETFDFRFEFYDVNNNFIPVDVLATKEFDGGNDFPTSGKLFTFESDRNAFRFSSGSIGNPPFQQIQFKTSQQNLTGSVTFASSAFDEDGNYIDPSSYGGDYPGGLTSITPAGSIITIANFSGSEDDVVVGSIIYTASLDGLEEFETVYRLEDGDNAPQLIVTSNANQFIYEPTTLSPKPSGQSITVRAQRKNLASLVTPIEVNSGSNNPGLTFIDTVNGIDTYTISATEFSESFSANSFDEVTYEFTGSDVFGNEQSDEITLSKVVNFDAVSLVLSNESTAFPAKSTGEVLGDLTPSSGSVQMFIGSNQITHDDELGGRTKNTFNITSSIGDNVTPTDTTPNTANYSISAFETAKDSGSLTLTIDYLAGDNSTTQSFQKIVSYTKSKKAVPTVLTKISPSTQTINSSSLGYDSPQTMEVIVQEGGDEYTFDSSNLSGGGDVLAQKFNINSLFVDSGSITNSDNILTFGSLTSSFNSIIGSASLDYVDSEGTYVTGKKVRFDLAVSKIGVDGINGASGSNARAVSLSSTKYAIVYDGDGNLFPANQDFTLSGSAQNFNTPEFQFLSGGAEIHPFSTTSEVIISSSGYPQRGDTSLFEVRVREQGGSDIGVFDNIDVFAVQSGSDAFTVFLTNEAHVFSATSESVVTSDLQDGAFETRFFRGADQYNFGTSGKTYSISATSSSIELIQSTNSNQRVFTPSSITADSGSATITVTDNNTGQTFDKKYSFTLSKEGLVGERGADGINGASGSNARAVSLSSTKYAVVYDGDGTLFPTSQPFTLSGSQQNFSNPQFQFLQNGSDISNGFGSVSELVIPTDTGSLPTAGGANLYEVRVRETGGSWDDFNVLDNIDVFGVQSGSDAFTVFLTNEAHVFSATSESVVTSNLSDGSFETRFFRGADQYNLGTTGKTYSISATSSSIELTQSTNSNQKLFTPTSITADSGSATIVVTDNNTGQTFDKQYSFTLSKEGLVGERGADGANGASGSNAKVVSLSSTKYAVVYDGDGTLFPTDQNFNLSGSSQNFTNPEFQFLSASAVLHDFASTSEVTISSSGYPEAGNATLYEVRVRENGGSYEGVFDNIDVFGVQSGSDSFTTFLTNEAHVFSANSDGVVTSTLADGSFETRFFRGAQQYNFGTSGKSYSVSATSSSIELTQSTNSNQRKFTPISVSADNGTASIILTDNNTGQTFPKTYTFSKSKKGAPVTTIAASPQSQTITSGSGGIGTPTDVTITVNEGGSDYGYDTAGAIPANKFRITGVTNATNNNDGTISPDTPISSTPVTGVATISYTNSEGTAFTSKTIPFDVGVAGLGDTGAAGSAGSDSLSIKLTASQYAVLYNGLGTKTAVAITLTGTHQNFSSPQYRFLENGTERQSWSTTSTYAIPDSQEAAANSTDLWRVEVREGGSGTYAAFDEVNIYGLKQGTDGEAGDPGTAGADSYTVILTNESHTLPTTNTGTVTYTGSGTSIIVYKGSTELNSVTSTPGTNEFKVTVTSDTNITVGSQTVTGNPAVFGVASACNANTANILFSINIENEVTIPKIQSFSKSIEGADGGPGGQGDNGRRTATGMVHYNTVSSTTPTGPDDGTTTFTFSTGVMSGMRSGWQMGAPQYAAGNSNKYWFATFTSLEETSLNGTAVNGNNDFGAVTQAIGFSGLVTFTAGNSESIDNGDGDLLSFGTAGTTKIHGDNIATGRIISTNYVTGSGDGFTNTGTLFDLDNSTLASPKFKITSVGDAVFRGTIDGGNLTIGTGSFTVSPDGAVNADNATIQGNVTANVGTIGGFALSTNSLTNTSNTIQLVSSANPVIKLQNSSNEDKLILSTAAALTPIGGTFSGLVIGVNATTVNSQTTLATVSGTTGGASNTNTNLSSGTATRFPNTGTISAAADGLTLTGVITLDNHTGTNLEIARTTISPGAGNALIYAALSYRYGVQILKNGSTLITTNSTPIETVVFGPGSTTSSTVLSHPAGAETFNYSFTVEDGAFYEFKTFVDYINVYADFNPDPFLNRSNTIKMRLNTPKITAATATLSAAGSVSFAEINQGGIQIITSAIKSVKSEFTNPDAFSVTGSLSATGNITAFASSDKRLKDNIELIQNPLIKVNKLNGVTFDWKAGFNDVHNFKGHDIGVIAQDVVPIIPEITKLNEINGYYGVKYEKLTPLLIEAVKELANKIEKLENKLKDKE